MKSIRPAIKIFLIVALVTMPLFSFAQTPPLDPSATGNTTTDSGVTITQAELRNLNSIMARIKPSYSRSDAVTIPNQTEINNAKVVCVEIGNKLAAITNKQFTMGWFGTSDLNASCTAAAYKKEKDSLDPLTNYRTYSNGNAVDGVQTYLSNLADGKIRAADGETIKTTITSTDYKTLTEQALKVEKTAGQWIDDIIGRIISFIANIIASILAFVATLALSLLHMIIDSTTLVARPPLLTEIWGIIRDFMNLVFIIALIVMALATILQRESYNYKNILVRLIAMALLINFSEAIAGAFVSFSDGLIRMMQPEGGFTSFSKLIFEGFVFQNEATLGNFFNPGLGITGSIGAAFGKIIALSLLTAALVSLSILMFVRLIGLWFLIVVSPVAYAMNVMPYTRKYANQWWDTFIKYLIWGPTALFFFRVAFILIERQGSGRIIDEPVLNYLFISAFIWAGYLTARSGGMMGAKIALGMGDKFLNKAKGLGIAGTKATGQYFWRGTAAKHLGATAEKFGVQGARKWGERKGERIGALTAKVTNTPKMLKEKFIDKGNEERKKLIAKEYRKMQIKHVYDKDLSKEIAGSMSAEDVHYLAREGKLNGDKVKAITEHGSRDAVSALALAMKDGHIKPGNKGMETVTEYNEIKGTIAKAMWKNAGGREHEMTKEFVAKLEDNIQVKATRTLNDQEKKMDPSDAKDALEKWARKTTDTSKDRKASVPIEIVRREAEIAREEAKAAAAAERSARAAEAASKAAKAGAPPPSAPPTPPGGARPGSGPTTPPAPPPVI